MRRNGKAQAASAVEMTEIILPEDTNQYGNAWGGRVMTLIDKAAAIAATRHCRTNVVTASVDSLVFRAPVKLGHILHLHAMVNAAFRTSLEVGVKVLSEDPLTGLRVRCCSAYVTMVALDANGRPTSVTPVRPAGPDGRRREREARRRRLARLEVRERKTPGPRGAGRARPRSRML